MSNSREIAGQIDGMNHKSIAMLPPSLRSAAAAFSLYVFNVGPDSFVRAVGTGTYYVPGRKKDERVSEPLKIDAVVYTTAQGETGMRWEPSEGWDVARDILQIGKMGDHTKFGLFISESAVPSDEEIETATAARVEYLGRIVQDADEAYQVNGGTVTVTAFGNSVTRSNITQLSRAALKELGWSRPWSIKNVQMESCWNCGRSVMPTSAKCFHEGCGAPLKNEDAKARFMAQDEDEPKRGPGRPRNVA
jgi:hypothetical protein